MSFYDQSLLAFDPDFNQRVIACVSTEDRTLTNPEVWVAEHRWQMAASPGFAADYASALAGGVPNPGRDEAVISDAEILSAVQALM